MPAYLSVRGYSDPPRIPHLSLEVNRGELVVIEGAPGSGKSRLVSALAGIGKPIRGELRILGCRPGVPGARERAVFVFQEQNFSPGRSVWSQLLRRLPLWGLGQDRAKTLLEEWCRDMKLLDSCARNPETINLSHLRLLSLAPLYFCKVAVVVLDEPLSDISSDRVGEVADIIRGIADESAVLAAVRLDNPLSVAADRIVTL